MVIYRVSRIEVHFNYLGFGIHGFWIGHSDSPSMRNSILFVVGNEGTGFLGWGWMEGFEDHAHNKIKINYRKVQRKDEWRRGMVNNIGE